MLRKTGRSTLKDCPTTKGTFHMATKCENRDRNMQHCNCTYTACDKKGLCCECVAYHRSRGELPACYFTDAQERTYDRSIAYFVRTHS